MYVFTTKLKNMKSTLKTIEKNGKFIADYIPDIKNKVLFLCSDNYESDKNIEETLLKYLKENDYIIFVKGLSF